MSTTPILDLEQLPPEPPKPWSSWLTGGLIGLLNAASIKMKCRTAPGGGLNCDRPVQSRKQQESGEGLILG